MALSKPFLATALLFALGLPAQALAANPTASFAALVAHRYGKQPGFSRCASVASSRTELACWAEVHRGVHYRLVSATGRTAASVPSFTKIRSRTWTRRWVKLPTSVVRSVGASGSASVNADGFDWAFLIAAASDGFNGQKLPAAYIAFDGDSSAMPRAIFRFRCSVTGRLVTCRNALGDALRYSPAR